MTRASISPFLVTMNGLAECLGREIWFAYICLLIFCANCFCLTKYIRLFDFSAKCPCSNFCDSVTICNNCGFPFSALTLWFGWQEGHPACKGVCRFVGGDDLTGALHDLTASVVTTTSIIILSCNKTGLPGKWPLIWRDTNNCGLPESLNQSSCSSSDAVVTN